MKVVQGRRITPLDADAFRALRQRFAHCLVDVGTGDGRFVYRTAVERPDTLCVGLDPVADALRKISAKAGRKPAKGGVENALFLVGAAEDLPGPLAGAADEITVNYPWGSLQRGIVAPEPRLLEKLAALADSATAEVNPRFTFLINSSVFSNEDYRDRLALPELDAERARGELVPRYREAGLVLETIEELAGDAPHHTSWGRRLVRGSGRHTLLLAGSVTPPVSR
jgi:16S rRNA (adenine(1408)-N(1))-methyltransferase